MRASTNDAYCPTLRGAVKSDLPEGVNSVLEIVIDGMDEESIDRSIQVGLQAACVPGIRRITAGNYGGNLGKFKFYLHGILQEAVPV